MWFSTNNECWDTIIYNIIATPFVNHIICRLKHLKILLYHLHLFLMNQEIHYRYPRKRVLCSSWNCWLVELWRCQQPSSPHSEEMRAYTLNFGLVSINYKSLYYTNITVPQNLIFDYREWKFPQKIWTFHTLVNMQWKFMCLTQIWITWSQKEKARPQSQIPNIYFR